MENEGSLLMKSNKIIRKLEKLQEDHPDQEIIVETPGITVKVRIGEAFICEGMNGEIVIEFE